jgi:shikimate kinase
VIKRRCVFVIGFMASGKTTMGSLLAKLLGRPFADTDDLIEEKSGMRIRELFEREGEARFRDLERELLLELKSAAGTSSGGAGFAEIAGGGGKRLGCLLSDLASGRGAVIATGGGLPCGSGNMRRMKEIGTVVYLRAGVDDILGRLTRTRDGADRPVFRKLKERAREKRGAGAKATDRGAASKGRALREELLALLDAREPFYLEADVVVENSDARSREETASRIVEALSALEPREEA